MMLETRAVTSFPLNDQEILLRHLHQTAHRYVDAYRSDRGIPSAPARVPAAS
jgi:hypothetical protein